MTARPDGTRHHTELINGTLVPGPPQRSGHSRVVTALTSTLMNQAPMSMEIERDMTLRLDARNHLVPDLLATPLPYDANRTWYAPADVRLVVEVVSPDSARRDRTVKPRAYAEAGIPHYWRVEDEEGAPVVHVHELDAPTGTYARVTLARDSLTLPRPFPISLDLATLTPTATRRTEAPAPHRTAHDTDNRRKLGEIVADYEADHGALARETVEAARALLRHEHRPGTGRLTAPPTP